MKNKPGDLSQSETENYFLMNNYLNYIKISSLIVQFGKLFLNAPYVTG